MISPGDITAWMSNHAPHRLASYVMPYLVILLTIVAIFSGIAAMHAVRMNEETNRTASVAAKNARELKAGLIYGCEHNGNALRRLLANRVRRELASPQKIKEYEDLFPQIPAAKLHALIKKSNTEKRAELRILAPVNCAALYR